MASSDCMQELTQASQLYDTYAALLYALQLYLDIRLGHLLDQAGEVVLPHIINAEGSWLQGSIGQARLKLHTF